MRRVSCPRCQTVVEFEDSQSPVCPKCGFGSIAAVSSPVEPWPGHAAPAATGFTPVPAAAPNPACPRCGSTAFSVARQGYGWGKGASGFCCCGPLGAFLGGVGAKKMERVCNTCGYRVKLG